MTTTTRLFLIALVLMVAAAQPAALAGRVGGPGCVKDTVSAYDSETYSASFGHQDQDRRVR